MTFINFTVLQNLECFQTTVSCNLTGLRFICNPYTEGSEGL